MDLPHLYALLRLLRPMFATVAIVRLFSTCLAQHLVHLRLQFTHRALHLLCHL